MINVVCGIKSTGRICTDLADGLAKQGHKVKIAYGREVVPKQYKKYAIRIGNDMDVDIHAGLARITDSSGFHSKFYTKQFIKWVKNFDPDVIHLHNIHGYYINVEMLFEYLRACGKRIIWTLHDCWSFTGHSVFCDAIDCRKWQTGCKHCPQKLEYPRSFLDRSARNWKKKSKIFTNIPNLLIVTPSHWLAGLVKKSYLKNYTVTTIYNGIDTSCFYPLENDFRKYYHLEDKFIILAVASTWNEKKGFNDYVKLAGMLDERYKIIMVGLTKRQIKDLPDLMFGLERTASTKELAAMYSASDVFLNLTYVDTYPTVNLEAAACGGKVVTYKTGGSPEGVEDVIVVEKGNLNAVLDVLKQLFKQRDSSKIIRKQNRSLIKDHKDMVIEYNAKYQMGGYFSTKSKKQLLGKRIVLAVSSLWEKRKGFRDVIEIAGKLSDDFQVVVIGIDDRQKRLLPNNVIAIDRTNDIEELRTWYALADVFINPTYEDNYPTTNLEAIACETPVITYDTGGSAESARMFGSVVKKGDYAEMINAIKVKIKTNKTLKIDFSEIMDRYFDIYQ